jgi:hypothetical protein
MIEGTISYTAREWLATTLLVTTGIQPIDFGEVRSLDFSWLDTRYIGILPYICTKNSSKNYSP